MARTSEVIPALSTRAHNRLNDAILAAVKGLANWSPTRIIGQPDAADAENLKHDLIELSDVVDTLVQAFGEYANSTLGLTQKDLTYFHSQLRDAIDGNATAVLDSVADNLRDLRSGSDGQRHDYRRGLLEAAE